MSFRVSILCILLLLCAEVAAQPLELEPREQTRAQDAEADRLLHEALAAYAADQLEQARALFETVHRLRSSARTLRALGVLAYRQERFAEAIALLEQSLASRVRPLTDELARGASELLGQARVRAEAVQQPSGSGREPVRSELPALVAPSPPVATGDLAAPTEPVRGPPAPNTEAKLRRLRRTAYSLFALAAAAVVVAAVGTGLGMKRVDEIEDSCRASAQGKCSSERAAQLSEGKRLELMSGLSIGGALVAGLSGVSGAAISIWVARRPDHPSTSSLRSLSLGVRLRF